MHQINRYYRNLTQQKPNYADKRVRPLLRRAARMLRPARVRIRSRKPWVLARRRLLGWNVRFMMLLKSISTKIDAAQFNWQPPETTPHPSHGQTRPLSPRPCHPDPAGRPEASCTYLEATNLGETLDHHTNFPSPLVKMNIHPLK